MKEAKDVVVLVVDDEDDLRRLIVRDFKRRGYQVLSAASGTEALALVQSHAIDVVLSDVRMPSGDGIELLNRIKELNPSLPVFIFITGRAEMTIEEALDWGADGVFDKPFDRTALFKAVADAVLTRDERWTPHARRTEVDSDLTLQFFDLVSAVETKALSIGRGGMFVAMDVPGPAVNSRLSFTITFEQDSSPPIRGTGVVRWVGANAPENRRAVYGIEFVDLDDDSRQQAIELIDSIRPRAFIPRC